ncbi:MAG: hypothetical protein ACFBSC_14850 [Microcoleaceae cyanobacterium]
MDSDSQPPSLPGSSGIRFSDIFGTLIALLTLALPLLVVARYSPSQIAPDSIAPYVSPASRLSQP